MNLIKLTIALLLALPISVFARDLTKAHIVTSMSKAAQCIASVHIRKIDGREIQVNRGGFELEPGRHTMSGSAKVDTTFCKVVGTAGNSDATPPLEAEFEAGKEYWVGLNHKPASRKDWEYVIWKIKDLKD